jgi:hypothetical protein
MADNPLKGLLSEDELELIKARRKEQQQNNERSVRIRSGDNEADVPWGEAVPWLKRTFGIGVSEDGEIETKDDKEAAADPEGEGDGKVRRFGRTVG